MSLVPHFIRCTHIRKYFAKVIKDFDEEMGGIRPLPNAVRIQFCHMRHSQKLEGVYELLTSTTKSKSGLRYIEELKREAAAEMNGIIHKHQWPEGVPWLR